MRNRSKTSLGGHFLFHPPVYFLFFLAVNLFLSYGTDSFQIKLWGGLIAVILPCLWMISSHKLKSKSFDKAPALKKNFSEGYGLLFLLAAAIIFRVFASTRLSAWPLADEASCPFYAMDLSWKEPWRFFFSSGQMPLPPFFVWFLALYFKIFSPGLLSLWMVPAFFSILTLLMVYFTVRKFLSDSLAFFCTAFSCFNFGLLYTGLFCMPTCLFLFWQILIFACCGAFWKARTLFSQKLWAIILGLGVGLGFGTWIAWIFVAFMIFLGIGYICLKKRKNLFIFFTVPLLLLFFFFFWRFVWESGFDYLRQVWALYPGMEGKKQAVYSLSTWTAFFWGDPWKYTYGPLWGGVLNPLAASLFFVGIVECGKKITSPFTVWIGGALFIFLLPGLVSRDFEFFRASAAIPLLILVLAIGAKSVSSFLPGIKRIMAVWVIIVLSAGLDIYHLTGPYHQQWGVPNDNWPHFKSVEYWKACEILKQSGEIRGPGILLADFQTTLTDQTLTVAAYTWDAVRRENVSLQGKNWLAVIIDVHYKPFLQHRFPKGQWFWLGNQHMNQGGIMLALIPIDAIDQPILQRWCEADVRLHSVTRAIMDHKPEQSQSAILEKLRTIYPFMKKDPFLESCFWEKVLYHEKIQGNKTAALEASRQCLKNGYPLPPVLNDEGVLLLESGKIIQARLAFQQAVQSTLNLTPAAENLKRLDKKE